MLNQTVVFESIYSESYDALYVDDLTDLKAEVVEEVVLDIGKNYQSMIDIEDDQIVCRYRYNEIRVTNPYLSDIKLEEITVNVREEVEYSDVKEEDVTCDTGMSLEYFTECEEKNCVVVKNYSFTLDVVLTCSKKELIMNYEQNFKVLQQEVYKADPSVGKCFESSVKYLDFLPADGVWKYDFLVWQTDADKTCIKTLTHGYHVTQPLVKKVFTQKTKVIRFKEGMSEPLPKKVEIVYECINEDTISVMPPKL